MSDSIKAQSESNEKMKSFEKEITLETTNLEQLFNSSKKYIIPGYQRPYEWKKEQLKSVVETIQKAIDEKKDYCVFGTIQLNKINDGKYEIIDGQQRLVTFWLLLNLCCKKELLRDSLNFKVDNQINKKYNDQFKDFEEKEKAGVYGSNYKELEKLINKDKHNEFSSFLIEKIVFVSVETDFRNKSTSTEDTIDLFDSLNTTGQKLDTKDIFKIRYYDYLKGNTNLSSSKIFEKINEAYKCIQNEDPVYSLSPEDLLDTFKFWILCNKDDNKDDFIGHTLIKQSNNQFFNSRESKAFGKNEIDGIEVFEKIANVIKRTQSIIEDCDKDNSENKLLLCAKELLAESGYWRVRNLFYVLIYSLAQKKNLIEKKDVITALTITQDLWKFYSIYYSVKGEILKEAFEFSFNFIVKPFVRGEIGSDECHQNIRSFFNEEFTYFDKKNRKQWWLPKKEIFEEFPDIIKGDIYNNNRKRLFTFLSYIDDCDKLGTNAYDIKRKAYYNDNKNNKWEIEHIISQGYIEEFNRDGEIGTDAINHIGNLIFLPHSINESLGGNTKNIKQMEWKDWHQDLVNDFVFKISGSCDAKGHPKYCYVSAKDKEQEENYVESVAYFLDDKKVIEVKKEFEKEDKVYKDICDSIKKIIISRGKTKKEFLRNTYKLVFGLLNETNIE